MERARGGTVLAQEHLSARVRSDTSRLPCSRAPAYPSSFRGFRFRRSRCPWPCWSAHCSRRSNASAHATDEPAKDPSMNAPVIRHEQRQQQTLTPRLQQAVRLLQLSSLDFAQEVQQAIGNNPFLEPDESEQDSSATAATTP